MMMMIMIVMIMTLIGDIIIWFLIIFKAHGFREMAELSNLPFEVQVSVECGMSVFVVIVCELFVICAHYLLKVEMF